MLFTDRELEFEAKATNAKAYRMNKLDKKRSFHLKLIIISFFAFLFLVIITSFVWQSWQMFFFCSFGVVCLIGLFDELIYEKRRTEILESFVSPDC